MQIHLDNDSRIVEPILLANRVNAQAKQKYKSHMNHAFYLLQKMHSIHYNYYNEMMNEMSRVCSFLVFFCDIDLKKVIIETNNFMCL